MSPIIDDLRVEAEIPPQTQRPGTAVVVTLWFSNLGTRTRTLFLIRAEAYRFGQSTFHLQLGAGPPIVQPPRQGGYTPTAADFHELGPRARLEFTQTLRLPRDTPTGKHTVQWVYHNEVDCWPSAPLPGTPGGGPIPGIWVGRIEDGFTLNVTRGLVGWGTHRPG
jgi:hypothetical protein